MGIINIEIVQIPHFKGICEYLFLSLTIAIVNNYS